MNYQRAMLISLCLTALIIEVFGVPGSAGGAKSGKSAPSKGSVSSLKNNAKQTVGPNAGSSKVYKASSGSILSAWGIISLVIFVIGGSALIYYISIFYPLVCAKRVCPAPPSKNNFLFCSHYNTIKNIGVSNNQ